MLNDGGVITPTCEDVVGDWVSAAGAWRHWPRNLVLGGIHLS